jgi:cytochrome c553
VRRWTTARLIIFAVAAALLVGALAAVDFIKSGLFDVAASKPHTKLTEWATHETMIHSVRRHARGIQVPRQAGWPQVSSGFCEYEEHCVMCHGAAGVSRQQWVNGMTPDPPYLLDATERWRPNELFWIVKHGIKMTGMPAWRETLTDQQIWNVVAWLQASRKLPPQSYARLRSQRRCRG